MIGFRINEEWLDFNATMGLEIRSPLFDTDSVPGIQSYPNSFENTSRNRRLLRFPATRSRQVGPVPPIEADCYLGGSLWRRGLLKYQDYDGEKDTYQYKFEADADALATQIEGVTLPTLNLGEVVTWPLQVETDFYVLCPVQNPAFYGDKPGAYSLVVNHYAGGFSTNAVTTFTPFVKVVPLLRALFGLYGYTVHGSWLDDEEIQRLLLYSTRSLDDQGAGTATSVGLAQLLPDVQVAELLIALQTTFCLGYVFHPFRREVEIRALRDVVLNPAYRDRPVRAAYRDVANMLDGFTLGYTNDGGDELLKNFVWPEVKLGNGKEVIRPAADTLRMFSTSDTRDGGRFWLLPGAEQKGYSARQGAEAEDNRLSHVRFLFYRGMQPDSRGQLYPLASSGLVNWGGQQVGNYSLQWDGPNGLYETWHKDWLAFRANARQEERTVPLNLGDFLALNPTQKEMVLGLKFLWERISVQVGGEGTIDEAKITYHQVR